ncbi:neurofilament heavy polypeptide-like [Trifolium medium]|uniref:Neurofilament heavy polypeptide-like n=1 Tax=Trifolium medium TaxID=97028 RepID=A0A392QC22_9FABA|nr:neurofilament heavy polypeptide-like [Trifolium medium]
MKAFEESVSFGRFMTETLEWEKWSTFSHNRYVEEAERISKPGSVAQKKAFFEAHYKKLAAQKAAALLEKSDSLKKQEHDEAQVVNTKVDGAELEKEEQDFEGNSMENQIEDVDIDDTHKDLSEKSQLYRVSCSAPRSDVLDFELVNIFKALLKSKPSD